MAKLPQRDLKYLGECKRAFAVKRMDWAVDRAVRHLRSQRIPPKQWPRWLLVEVTKRHLKIPSARRRKQGSYQIVWRNYLASEFVQLFRELYERNYGRHGALKYALDKAGTFLKSVGLGMSSHNLDKIYKKRNGFSSRPIPPDVASSPMTQIKAAADGVYNGTFTLTTL